MRTPLRNVKKQRGIINLLIMALACSRQAIDVFTTIGYTSPNMALGQIATLVPSDKRAHAYLE